MRQSAPGRESLMLVAQLRGKLAGAIWEQSEDLLTSAVFGTLKNLPASLAVRLLSRVRPLAGSSVPSLTGPLSWSFWPWWQTCEPDVVVGDAATVCLLEAKLGADFGEDVGAGKQLAREWRDGVGRARSCRKAFWLIAVTNHASPPWAEMLRQLEDIDVDLGRVGWLSWGEVARCLEGPQGDSVNGWCVDLLELLGRMGLIPFSGFEQLWDALSALDLAHVPWVARPPVGPDLANVGFSGALAVANSRVWNPDETWNLGSDGSQPAFEMILRAARNWAEQGARTWNLLPP